MQQLVDAANAGDVNAQAELQMQMQLQAQAMADQEQYAAEMEGMIDMDDPNA